MVKAPLINPTLPDDKLAGWIDANTMAVHQFLDKLDLVSHSLPEPESQACLLL